MAGTLGWGILSTGHIAGEFAHDLNDFGFRLVAVGSRTPEAAQRFAHEHGVPTAHGSYEELVADDAVDIVYVASPIPFHVEHAMLALNAGKHVLLEKPFTLNAHEARAVAELAAEKGLLVLEAMWTRFLPHIARLREIIESGTLGTVRTFTADHAQRLPDDPAHRLNDPALGGGALLDLGIYPVSFASFLFGTPRTVQASARYGDTGVDAEVAAIFHYADGGLATTVCAKDARGANTATIVGSDARIEIDAIWFAPTSFRVIASDGTVLETYDAPIEGRGRQFQAEEAERVIAAGETASPLMTPEESVSIMETLDEIRGQIGLVYPGE